MFNPTVLKFQKTPLLLVLISMVLYALFAYDLMRTEYTKIIILYTGLFIIFYRLMKTYAGNFQFLVVAAIALRLVFLIATPNLSQDFYRFIWDGRMILEGYNPYLYTPESFISVASYPIAQAQALYDGMGMLNASHFTNYPPVKQFIFMTAALFSGKSILGSTIVYRVVIIAADIGTLYLGQRLLKRLNMPIHHIFLYVLNPFIIIELTGNLHFEGIMIFFLVWSLYLLHLGKWKTAGVIMALSISVKLLPLLLLPLFFKYFIPERKPLPTAPNELSILQTQFRSFPKLIGFYSIIGLTTLLLFAPFYSSTFVTNYAQTVGLWFNAFEFNASLYYMAREIGYWLTGYNQIAVIGTYILILTLIVILLFTFFRKNATLPQLISTMLLTLSIYFFMSTTVHPWYLATLLLLSVFTNYRFPLVWSFVIILSYLAYANPDNTENLWLTGLQYGIVYSVFLWEIFKKKDRQLAVS